MRKPKSYKDHEILHDLLLLVCYDVPVEVLRTWTTEQCLQAEKYACKTHLRASDNIVCVPPRPALLNGFEEKLTPIAHGALYGTVLPPSRRDMQ